MIVDTIENIGRYMTLGSIFAKALNLLSNIDQNSKNCDYWIDDNIRVIINDYETKINNDNKFEVHSKTIDIQYPLRGEELVQWVEENESKVVSKYEVDFDRKYHTSSKRVTDLTIGKNKFVVFFPGELHNPGLATYNPIKIKKLTIKIVL
jgi:YhcH/YjgK/YiaL family protein